MCDWCYKPIGYTPTDEGPHLCEDCEYCYWNCEPEEKHRKECPYWEVEK